MSYFTVKTVASQGLQTEMVRVEADVSNGLPVFLMVGYLSSEVKEASERVRTAIRNAGYMIPPKRIVVNLSPANVRKRGTAFDLPIAIAILAALGVIPVERLKETLFIGELGLNGEIRPVDGILSVTYAAKKQGLKYVVLPRENEREGKLNHEIQTVGLTHLTQVCEWVKGKERMIADEGTIETDFAEMDVDYGEIQGQESVKRATLVAVAGNHNLLYIGPPGAGKTMMAKRIPTILPELTWEESMELTKIYSAVGQLKKDNPLITKRPFREVHHTITRAALLGGGSYPRPGEITLAHGGVLFLDELAEFRKSVLEGLRQPLEEKCVRIVRGHGAYVFPADFMLIGATNPCVCGNYPGRECQCSPAQIRGYIGKISRPLLDRMDLCVEAPKVKYEDLTRQKMGTTSEQMRKLVTMARRRQQERFCGQDRKTNAQMTQEDLKKYCELNVTGERMMRRAYETMHLTARSYHKILKVARTIADLDGAEKINEAHIGEAIGYRMIDEKYWGA